MLPLSATLIHAHVHEEIEWIFYMTLFDTVAITALFYFPKTKVYGFWLNTVLCLGGIIYHFSFSPTGTLADSMIIIADLAIGYVLYVTNYK
jgi:hypothetical membrane protein